MNNNRRRALLAAVLLTLMVSIAVAAAVSAARPLSPAFKPSSAEDVELVKKVVLKGPKARGGKPSKGAATGILGELCYGTKYAIVIGVSDYPGEENDLEYADDDANDVYWTLVEIYNFDPDNVHLLIDANATIDNVIKAIEEVKSEEVAEDEVVFFFSGHGARGFADDGDSELIDEAIVLHDGSNLVYLWDGDLVKLFSGFDTSRIVLVFDSCLSGGMNDLKAKGRIVVASTTEHGVAYEGDQWQNGQFTYYFFEQGMYYGKADKYDHNGDGVYGQSWDVTVEEAFDYAKTNCKMQRPTIYDQFENDLLL
ncbi:MAG: caspase family protein [Thermoprotei archaeon]|mgnify:CR=1 FL=1|nr:MAG: caspase family protein [Thermoprotei archaeon]